MGLGLPRQRMQGLTRQIPHGPTGIPNLRHVADPRAGSSCTGSITKRLTALAVRSKIG